jgi:hypothetical protein
MPQMIILALISTALAQSPVAALQARPDSGGATSWALSCAPAADIVEILQILPLDDGRAAQQRTELQKVLVPLLRPGAIEATGLDLSGAVVLSGSHGESTKASLEYMSLPFTGTSTQAGDLVEVLFKTVQPGADPRTWITHEDGQELTIQHTAQAIVVTAGNAAPATADQGGSPSLLLEGLPQTPGCAMVLQGRGLSRKARAKLGPLSPDNISVFIPTRGGASHLRMQTGLALKTAMTGAEIESELGSSVDQPDVVALIAMDPIALAAELAGFLPASKKFNQIKQGLRSDNLPIQIPPGTVLAGFKRGNSKRVAAIIPVHSRRGKKVWACRLTKNIRQMLEGLGAPVSKAGRNRLTVGGGSKTLHIGTQRGLVFVSSDATLLEQMLDGTGQSWVSSGLRQLARSSALSGEMQVAPTPESPATVLRGGLGQSEGVWELQVQLELPELKSQRLVDMLKTAFEINPQLKEKMGSELNPPSPHQTLSLDLGSILTAELAYKADYNAFVAIEQWPRPVTELSREAVPWRPKSGSSEGFDQIGWKPDAETTMGTYWVELSSDGKSFTVFGALDSDGDGVPARYKLESTAPKDLIQITGPEIY